MIRPALASTGLAFLLLLSAPSAQQAQAQSQGRSLSRTTQGLTDLPLIRDQLPNVYEFVRAGEPSIKVLVVGSVGNKGFYYVRPGTNLEEILLYSGGPVALGQLQRADVFKREKIRPEVRFTLSRMSPDSVRYLASEVKLSTMLDGDLDLPVLQDDDIVLVETEETTPPLYRDVLSVVQTFLGVFSSSLFILYVFGVAEQRN